MELTTAGVCPGTPTAVMFPLESVVTCGNAAMPYCFELLMRTSLMIVSPWMWTGVWSPRPPTAPCVRPPIGLLPKVPAPKVSSCRGPGRTSTGAPYKSTRELADRTLALTLKFFDKATLLIAAANS